MDELLSNGAPVGFTDDMIQLAASIIQLSFRTYRLLVHGNKPVDQNDKSSVQRISEMRTRRKHMVNKYNLLRSRLKLPIAEAAYNGRWEIIDLIDKKDMFHFHFAHSWSMPSPLPPRKLTIRHEPAGHWNMVDLVAYGMNDLSSGELVQSVGWVNPDHELSAFGMCQEKLSAILRHKLKLREEFLAQRHRKRLIVLTLKRQSMGNAEMVKAILEKDIPRCVEICEDFGTSIDFETEHGFTALIAAAEERVIGPDHVYLRHRDGTPCLQVEFLLDREVFRPSINYETETGLTALIHACSLDRFLVAQSLIERGASINYQNKFKRTAAHYASSIGSAQCIRLLIERGGDMFLPDEDGATAMDIAHSKNLAQVIQVISKVAGGNLGPVTYKRGLIETLISCPLGCKAKIPAERTAEHTAICDLRQVACEKCGVKLLFCDLEEHISQICQLREVKCSLCGDAYLFKDEADHAASICSERLVPCPNGCSERRRQSDIPLHLPHCTWRIVDCTNQCKVSNLRLKDSLDHLKYDCPHRRVDCNLNCGHTVIAKEMLYHLQNICPNRPAQCKYCGEGVHQIEKLQHEKNCSHRSLPCPYKCGAVVTPTTREEHIKSECKHRFISCPFKCRLGQIRAIDLEKHTLEECENRLVCCPLGCVDQQTNANTLIAQHALNIHCKYECPERPVRCARCGQCLKAKESELHTTLSCSSRVVNCRVHGCCKSLSFSEVGSFHNYYFSLI